MRISLLLLAALLGTACPAQDDPTADAGTVTDAGQANDAGTDPTPDAGVERSLRPALARPPTDRLPRDLIPPDR